MKRYYGFLLVFAVALMFSFAGCDGNVPAATGPAPAAPTGLTVLSVTDTGAELEWDAVTDVDMYEVYNGATSLGRVGSTDCEVSDLSPNTSYNFYVEAINKNGISTPSPIAVKTAPAAPVIKVKTSSGTVTLEWDGRFGATGYNVYKRAEESDKFVFIGSGNGTYTDTDVDVGEMYYYGVSCTVSNGESAQGAAVSITVK